MRGSETFLQLLWPCRWDKKQMAFCGRLSDRPILPWWWTWLMIRPRVLDSGSCFLPMGREFCKFKTGFKKVKQADSARADSPGILTFFSWRSMPIGSCLVRLGLLALVYYGLANCRTWQTCFVTHSRHLVGLVLNQLAVALLESTRFY